MKKIFIRLSILLSVLILLTSCESRINYYPVAAEYVFDDITETIIEAATYTPPSFDEPMPAIHSTEINECNNGIVWVVLPHLEYERVYRNIFGHYVLSDPSYFYQIKINPMTGQPTGEGIMSLVPSGPYVYDIERSLFGQHVYGWEYRFSFGMHPLEQFPEILYTWGEDISWFTNPQLRGVAGVDSSMRHYWGVDESWWGLAEDAFSGKYAIMNNNLQFVTDFVFDWAADNSLFDIIEVHINNRYGIVDVRGEIIIPTIFEHIVIICDNTAFAKFGGRYGILDIGQTAERLHQFLLLNDNFAEPIDFAITKRINSELPYFTFRFQGETVWRIRLNVDRALFQLTFPESKMQAIIITDENGRLIQEIINLDLHDSSNKWPETLRFADWNFDGYLDFALPYASFWATAYFIWDSTNNLFVRNEELELLGGRYDVFAIYETERLRVSGGRMNSFFVNYYEYLSGEIILVKSILERHELIEKTEEGYLFAIHFTYYELVGGEMVVVDKTEYIELW